MVLSTTPTSRRISRQLSPPDHHLSDSPSSSGLLYQRRSPESTNPDDLSQEVLVSNHQSTSRCTTQHSPIRTHSSTHSLSSNTIELDSDSELSQCTPISQTHPSPPSSHTSYPNFRLHTFSSFGSLSSTSSSQSIWDRNHPPISTTYHSIMTSPTYIKTNLPYKRIISKSISRRSLSLSQPRLLSPSLPQLPLSMNPVPRPKFGSRLREFLIQEDRRQSLNRLFRNFIIFVIIITIFAINLIYFVNHFKQYEISPHHRHHPQQSVHRNSLREISVEEPERDCLMIYRIIGNDLPPRHSPNQTLTNLKFLLENEDDFNTLPSLIPTARYSNQSIYNSDTFTQASTLKVKKYFILNRIANVNQSQKVLNLLTSSGVPINRILIIPFEIDEYQKRDFRFNNQYLGPEFHQLVQDSRSKSLQEDRHSRFLDIDDDEKRRWAMNRLRALDSIYHEKNLYAMNNNGGRNFGLTHARLQPDSRWSLVLDGNCFLTPSALRDMVKVLVEQEVESILSGTKPPSHVIIPMSRLLDNREVLANNSLTQDIDFKPLSVEEPQIGFRFSSNERYSSRMRYGRRSKIEFLWRLGAIRFKQNRIKRSIPHWENEELELITDDNFGSVKRVTNQTTSAPEPRAQHQTDFVQAGWVHRLFSGDDKLQEEPTEIGISRRSINRIKGIVWFLEELDERRLSEQNNSHDRPKLFNLDLQKWSEFKDSDAQESIKLKQTINRIASLIITKSTTEAFQPQRAIHAFILMLAFQLQPQSIHYLSTAIQIIRSNFLMNVRNQPLATSFVSYTFSAIDPIGYYFPPRPLTRHSSTSSDISSSIRSHSLLPLFRPTESDLTFYLDALKLLSTVNPHFRHHKQNWDLTKIEKEEIKRMIELQTQYMIHLQPQSNDVDNRHGNSSSDLSLDINLIHLAHFINDHKLMNRILTRTRLKISCQTRQQSSLQSELVTGLQNLGYSNDLIPCIENHRTGADVNLSIDFSSTAPLTRFLSLNSSLLLSSSSALLPASLLSA